MEIGQTQMYTNMIMDRRWDWMPSGTPDHALPIT